ncbi:MAG: hypothetical protein R2713_03120 [Ilumatobacteraceae bacterium]
MADEFVAHEHTLDGMVSIGLDLPRFWPMYCARLRVVLFHDRRHRG